MVLENEAKKYAALLGYNYQSSEWYKESYRVFNKDYEDPKDKIKKNKQNVIIRNFKKLLNKMNDAKIKNDYLKKDKKNK